MKLGYKMKRGLLSAAILFAVILLIDVTMEFTAVAEFFYARVLSRYISLILQSLASLIPFSIYEFFVCLLVSAIIIAIIISICWHNIVIPDRIAAKSIYGLVVFFCIAMVLYSAIGTALYRREPVTKALNINTSEITDNDMQNAAAYYIDNLNELAPKFDRDESGMIVSPYSFEELNELIALQYEQFDSGYFSSNNIKLKKVTLSRFMTYTGITGLYVAILGEASINTNVPSYTLPVTMAHEMAHSKGVMHENEANFVAYYLCVNSDNDYLRYCGLMYAANICTRNIKDKSTREEIINKFDERVLTEYRAVSEFYAGYEGVFERIAEFFNNFYLKSAGVAEGTASYSMTDKFLVGMYFNLQSK